LVCTGQHASAVQTSLGSGQTGSQAAESLPEGCRAASISGPRAASISGCSSFQTRRTRAGMLLELPPEPRSSWTPAPAGLLHRPSPAPAATLRAAPGQAPAILYASIN